MTPDFPLLWAEALCTVRWRTEFPYNIAIDHHPRWARERLTVVLNLPLFLNPYSHSEVGCNTIR